MKIKNRIIYSDEGKYIARASECRYAEDFGTAFPMREKETMLDFVEVDVLPESRPDPADLPAPKEDSEENKMINALIRAEYTESEELSINRQKDASPEKHAEWERFNAFCEKCKAQVKAGKVQK